MRARGALFMNLLSQTTLAAPSRATEKCANSPVPTAETAPNPKTQQAGFGFVSLVQVREWQRLISLSCLRAVSCQDLITVSNSELVV